MSTVDLCLWMEQKDSKGRTFYCHIEDERTVWQMPTEYKHFLQELMPGWGVGEAKDEAEGSKAYFYNVSLGKRQWDVPEEFEQVVAQVRKRQKDGLREVRQRHGSGIAPWKAVLDATKGKHFYYNDETKESKWNAPESVAKLMEDRRATMEEWVKANPLVAESREAQGEGQAEEHYEALDDAREETIDGTQEEDMQATQDTQDTQEELQEEELAHEDDQPEQEPMYTVWDYNKSSAHAGDHTYQAEQRSNAVVEDDVAESGEPNEDDHADKMERLQVVEAKLSRPDAIMNSDVMLVVKEYVELSAALKTDGKAQSGAIKLLSDNYKGYADMCRIMRDLLLDAEVLALTPSAQLSEHDHREQLHQQEVFKEQMHFADMIEKNFNRQKVDDSFYNLSTAPSFLTPMMEDDFWRNFLIKMRSKHKDSALMSYCLRQISKSGHYNEIAHHIQETEQFEIYRDVLVDMVAKIPHASNAELGALVEDLKRMCCSSEYMFMFAEELLLRVEKMLQREAQVSHDDKAPWTERQSSERKIRRLREELEGCAIWSKRAKTSGYLEPSAQFALKLTALADYNLVQLHGPLMSELLSVLRNNNLDALSVERIYDSVFSKLIHDPQNSEFTNLPAILDEIDLSAMDTEVLRILQYPQVLQLFTDAAFHPQKRSLDTQHAKQVCALLCIAVICEPEYTSTAVGKPTAAYIFGQLVEAASILKTIDSTTFGLAASNAPEHLAELMCTPVASACVLRWVECVVLDTTFTSKPAYLSMAPVLLHLLVTAISLHPLQRPPAFNVLKLILTLSDTSEQMDSVERGSGLMKIRKDAIECLVYLMSTGFVRDVLSFLLTTVASFDQALVRHLVTTLSMCIEPPYSKTFSKAMVGLLLLENVRKAIDSRHISTQRTAVQALLDSFVNCVHVDTEAISQLRIMRSRLTELSKFGR